MRAIRFHQFGEPADVLRVDEVPAPEPGPGEVLVWMRVRTINPSDLLTVRGVYPSGLKPPATPGFEGMGVVERVGEGVTRLRPGHRVIPLGSAGTWQEYLCVREDQLVPVPDPVSDASAAQFVVNPLTAWVMLTEELKLQPGDCVLQTAAGSTLGRVVLQIAALRRLRVINVVRRRAQAEELAALGAQDVICTEDEDLEARVHALTGGKGVSAAIEAVGGETGAAAVRSLAAHGTLLVYGLLSSEPIPLDSGRMIFRSLNVRGFWLGDWFRTAPAERRQQAAGELLRLMASGEIVPPVEAEYDLGEIAAAVRHAGTPGRRGKVLLTG